MNYAFQQYSPRYQLYLVKYLDEEAHVTYKVKIYRVSEMPLDMYLCFCLEQIYER